MIIEAFVLTCDNCGTRQAYDARFFLPQEALADASCRHNWTMYNEHTHCADCPPLCPRCGDEYGGLSDWCVLCAITHG